MVRQLHGIYVGHWAGNLGDSAVFDVLDQSLPATVRFTLEVESVGAWRARPQTTFIQHADVAAVQSALAACDAVVIPGTTIVTDLHANEWPIAWVARAVDQAGALGKPVVAVGVGVYPGERDRANARWIRLANAVAGWTVRDAASRAALVGAGVPAERVTLAADLAWLLQRPADAGAARAEMAALTGGRPALAVNVVHEDWLGENAFYETFARELDAWHQQTGDCAVFFCNEIREGALYDAAAARRVMALMRSPAVLYPNRWRHPEELIARLACCEQAVSMRYHFCVFATLAGVVWSGFARGAKCQSLLAEFARDSALVMGQLRPGQLVAELLSCRQQRAQLVAAQNCVQSRLQHRAQLCRHQLQELWTT